MSKHNAEELREVNDRLQSYIDKHKQLELDNENLRSEMKSAQETTDQELTRLEKSYQRKLNSVTERLRMVQEEAKVAKLKLSEAKKEHDHVFEQYKVTAAETEELQKGVWNLERRIEMQLENTKILRLLKEARLPQRLEDLKERLSDSLKELKQQHEEGLKREKLDELLDEGNECLDTTDDGISVMSIKPTQRRETIVAATIGLRKEHAEWKAYFNEKYEKKAEKENECKFLEENLTLENAIAKFNRESLAQEDAMYKKWNKQLATCSEKIKRQDEELEQLRKEIELVQARRDNDHDTFKMMMEEKDLRTKALLENIAELFTEKEQLVCTNIEVANEIAIFKSLLELEEFRIGTDPKDAIAYDPHGENDDVDAEDSGHGMEEENTVEAPDKGYH